MVTSRSPIRTILSLATYLYTDVTLSGEGLQNSGFRSVFTPFEQEGVFIILAMARDLAGLHRLTPPPLRSVVSDNTPGVWRTYFSKL